MHISTVMTTIQSPTKISTNIINNGKDVIVVGDKNTPSTWKKVDNITFIPWASGELTNSYSRKNMGYLKAIKNGADYIFDMDDDNDPNYYWGRCVYNEDYQVLANNSWINVYNYFGTLNVWPRGLPLNAIRNEYCRKKETINGNEVVIWQSLANVNPDTDAIYRLLFQNKETFFLDREPIILSKNTICPFNAQNTLFKKEAFPLLYLPITVNMRFSDILRSVVAQPILWERNLFVGFTKATVLHQRHKHDLMKDFYDELECYKNIEKAYDVVKNSICKEASIKDNMLKCYSSLYEHDIVEFEELNNLCDWLGEV